MSARFSADFNATFGGALTIDQERLALAAIRDAITAEAARPIVTHSLRPTVPIVCTWCDDEGCSECDPVAREESRGAFRRGY